MMSDWPILKVGDLEEQGLLLVQDGNHGEYRPRKDEFTDIGVAFIRAADLGHGAVQFTASEKINEAAFDRIRKGIGKDLDTILSTKGTVGKIAFVPEGSPQYVCSPQTSFWRSLNHAYIDPNYLFYEVQSRQFNEQILSRKGETDMADYLSLTSQRGLTIRVPPIEVQRKLAAILGSLDDKIDLNRQTNQTLEQIAQAIFKSWFVDFDPVRAKIAAREAFIQQHPEVTLDAIRAATGTEGDTLAHAAAKACELAAMSAISGKTEEQLNELDAVTLQQLKATAALFPENLVDTEHGELPVGWEYKALDEIAHYQNGLALQNFRPQEGDESLPVVKISQLSKGFADGEERASANIKRECIIENGDVVFSWSGSLMVDTWCGGKAALNQHLFKVTSEEYPKWFYYHYTKHHLSSFQQIAADKAVTMGHIKRTHLTEAMCAVPRSGLDGISLMVDLLNKQIELRLESTTLQVVRDALLPKLLSGELSVENATTDKGAVA